jgi:hypothetical protein
MSSKENFLSVYGFLFVVDLTFSTDVRTVHVCPCSSCAPRYISRSSASLCKPPDLVETLWRDDFPILNKRCGRSVLTDSNIPAGSQFLRRLSPRSFFVPHDFSVLMTSLSSWLPRPHGFFILSALLFHDTNGQTLHEQSQTAIGGT